MAKTQKTNTQSDVSPPYIAYDAYVVGEGMN